MEVTDKVTDLAALSASIVRAYVQNNAVSAAHLPQLVRIVHQAVLDLRNPDIADDKPVPAVPINRSITADYLISLEDGKSYKVLKRHLRRLGMTADDYRTKWGLPEDYPMVAPKYSQHRSYLSKSFGLGLHTANRSR